MKMLQVLYNRIISKCITTIIVPNGPQAHLKKVVLEFVLHHGYRCQVCLNFLRTKGRIIFKIDM